MARLANFLWVYLDLVGSVLVLTAVFYVFEALAPAEKGQPASKRFFNMAYYPFIAAGILVLQFGVGPVYSYSLARAGGGLLPRLMNPPGGLVAELFFALAFAVIWDVWQYWVHRLQHTWPVLWETHKFHHTETALNSSTQARQHLSNYVLFTVLYVPVMLFFGSFAPHFVAMFVMFRVWGFVNHANCRFDFGSLTPIVAGPQWHRIHHSIYPEHRDRNFAVFFPFIDRLFGTYYRPGKDEYPPTGLPVVTAPAADGRLSPDGDLASDGYLASIREATVEPFIGWYEIAAKRFRGETR